MKKTPLRSRKAPLRSSGPPERRTRIRARNPERSAREWKRAFHSIERVEFVNGLACANIEEGDCCGPNQNAHTLNDGKSRRGGYRSIIPLCAFCHSRQHGVNGGWARLPRLDTPGKRRIVAARTEKLWSDHLHQQTGAGTT